MANEFRLWTSQADIVLDTIERDGTYYVKKYYVEQKYQETAWIFKTAYEWFAKQAQMRISRPAGAEFPVWMFMDGKWAGNNVGYHLMELSVPKEEVVLFDLRDWNRILNLSYVGEDGNEFEKYLRKQGIMASSDVFLKPYYPVLRQQIVKSWDRLFEAGDIPETYIQAAAWQIKREWIKHADMEKMHL